MKTVKMAIEEHLAFIDNSTSHFLMETSFMLFDKAEELLTKISWAPIFENWKNCVSGFDYLGFGKCLSTCM